MGSVRITIFAQIRARKTDRPGELACRQPGRPYCMYGQEALKQQTQLLDLAAVLRSAGTRVDTGRVDIAVTENRSQMLKIPLKLIKAPGEQMPQIVREHLLRVNKIGRASCRERVYPVV